jgi:hypothetical protein
MTGQSSPQIIVAEFDNSKQIISGTWGQHNNVSSRTFTTSASSSYVRVSYRKDKLENMQLELGSTATAYEPYQGQSYEVNLGKNLLDLNGFVKGRLDNGVLGHASNTTALSVDGDSISFTTNANYRGITTEYIPVDPNGTYSTNIPTTGIYGAEVAQYDSAKNFISQGAVYATQTYSGTTHYIRIYLFLRNSGSATLDDLQFERGSQATSYAAYFEPIELCKIGDYQDYIWNDNGTWKVHKEVGKVSLSSITWETFLGNLKRSGTNPIANMAYVANNQQVGFGLTEGFQIRQGSGLSVASLIGYFAIDTDRIAFNVGSGGSDPVGNLYYALATPTDTEITNEALIAQLDALLNTARTYAGINNIFTITPNEQGTLEITYYTERDSDKRDELIIDSRMRTVTLNGTDVYHLIAAGSEFPMLAPGENKLMLRSDIPGDNGYAEVNYKQGYLSI